MSGKSVYFQAIVKEGADAYCAGMPASQNPYAAKFGPIGHKKRASWLHGWHIAMVEHDRQVIARDAERNRAAALARAGIE